MSTSGRGQHLIGRVLGAAVLESSLGYGGSSAVYLAQQSTSEEKVAVKVFLPRSTATPQMRREFYKRFLHEAEVASELDHPHVLPIYSYGEQDGLPYIIMPHMSGGTLYEYVSKHGYLSLEETQFYLAQVASALDYIHEQGCVHCDVKPANILLDTDHQVMLSDFGIARVSRKDAKTGEMISKGPETLMGTPDYISPEQALGQKLDGRSDIYSLGITVYYLLSGQLPFHADASITLSLKHVHEPPPALSLIRADIPPEVDHVLQKALAKQPADRYQTANEFCTAFIQAVASTTPVLVGKRSRGGISDGFMKASISVKPVSAGSLAVQTQGEFPAMRILFAMLVLFMLVVGGIAAGGYFITHSAPPTVTPVSSRVDLLTTHSNQWPVTANTFFKDQAYYIRNTSLQGVTLALYSGYQVADFQLDVTMAELQGSRNSTDYFGVIFRAASDLSHYYVFEIATGGGNGQYVFWRYDGNWKSLASGAVSSLIHTTGAKNKLTVDAQGNTFSFSVNNVQVGSAMSDSSKTPFASGQVGLYVEQQGTEVAFSQFYIQAL